MQWTFGQSHPRDAPPKDPASHRRRLRHEAVRRARTARVHLIALIPMVGGVVAAYHFRHRLGAALPVRIATAVVLVVLGWALARSLGRALGPLMLDRLDPATTGIVDFLIRLATLLASIIAALRISGLNLGTLAIGGAVSGVVLGLAAQQTLANLFAGVVLLTTRPFRIGDRVRIKAGAIGGGSEGIVRGIGLFYTTIGGGAETAAVPNSVVITSAIVPVRQPAAVEFRAWLRPDVAPEALQATLDEMVKTPTLEDPYIDLEEFHQDEVVMRVSAVPRVPDDGAKLAGELLRAVARVSG